MRHNPASCVDQEQRADPLQLLVVDCGEVGSERGGRVLFEHLGRPVRTTGGFVHQHPPFLPTHAREEQRGDNQGGGQQGPEKANGSEDASGCG